METKKSNSANVLRHRMTFLQIGLISSILLVILAFQWKSELPSYRLPLKGESIDEDSIILLPPIAMRQPTVAPPVIEEGKIKISEFEAPKIFDPEKNVEPAIDYSDFEEEFADTAGNYAFEFHVKRNKTYTGVVELMPQFQGGELAMFQFFNDKINYPTFERDNNIAGIVVVSFVVTRNGKINNIQLVKGISKGLDQAALDIVSKMPDWIPGQMGNKNVNVKIHLPIHFRLK